MLEFHIIKLYLFLNKKKNSILLSRKLKNQQQPIVLPIHDSRYKFMELIYEKYISFHTQLY
jgi:hypothetical protein